MHVWHKWCENFTVSKINVKRVKNRSSTMKIAMAHSRFIWFGGTERSVLEVSRRLAARHQVTIYTSNYEPHATYAGLADFPIVTIPKWQWATTHLKEDVIFAYTYSPNMLVYRNKHVAFYVQAFMNNSSMPSPLNRPERVLRQLLVGETLRRNQRILAMSNFIATRLQAAYHQAATDVIYGGIDPDYFNLSVKTGDYALYVGRLEPGKGLDRLLAWWQSIDYDLVLVGTGDPAYVRTLQQYNNPRVSILAPKFGEELAKIYQNCRFVVFLSYAEGLGLVPLEAMAAAKPVIAANEGGPAETVIHGTTGFLVNSEAEFCQAVAHLIASEQTCQVMGAAGRQHVRQFTWDNIAERMERIALEMVES
jgi:glycosyltransferase involved in cell wall biosynthesis